MNSTCSEYEMGCDRCFSTVCKKHAKLIKGRVYCKICHSQIENNKLDYLILSWEGNGCIGKLMRSWYRFSKYDSQKIKQCFTQ